MGQLPHPGGGERIFKSPHPLGPPTTGKRVERTAEQICSEQRILESSELFGKSPNRHLLDIQAALHRQSTPAFYIQKTTYARKAIHSQPSFPLPLAGLAKEWKESRRYLWPCQCAPSVQKFS